MRFYHRTTEERRTSILRGGFRDGTGTYFTDREWSGVWIADRRIDVNDGDWPGDTFLQLDTDEDEAFFDFWEWKDPGKWYREWLIPAAVLNEHCTIKRVSDV